MSNNISAQLLAQFYGQESSDPLLMLVTVTPPGFSSIYLVNNTEPITSRGITYQNFPMLITMPMDDGETERQVSIEFDNVSRELISELRSHINPMDVKIEMILASDPDFVQISLEDLKMRHVTYDKSRIRAKLYMDSFLNVELTNERYVPSIFPGMFQVAPKYASLIGTPYDKKDCYKIAQSFYEMEMNYILPSYYASIPSKRSEAKELIYNAMSDFEKVATPQFGDLVLIRMPSEDRLISIESHIAVYLLDGKILHTTEKSGCLIEGITRWERLIVGFYRLKKYD